VILVDTSAWVEYLRATGSPAHLELRELIASGAPLATTDPVVMELLAGARDDDHVRQLQRLLLGLDHIPVAGLADYERAAALYRSCRERGQPVRSLIDCLIATVAIRERVPVLEQDRDFRMISTHTDLRLHIRA
jgi:predicted nucleic acid-binding protein